MPLQRMRRVRTPRLDASWTASKVTGAISASAALLTTVPRPQQMAAPTSAARSRRSIDPAERSTTVVRLSSSPCRRSTPTRRPAARDRADRSTSGRASAGLVALTIALIIPSVTSCDGVIETSANPTASRPWRNSLTESAPAMQPAYEPRSARSSGVRRSSATMSVIPMRPPGRSTRAISREHGRLVRSQIDDAVADHDIDRLRRQRQGLDRALQEFDVRRAGFRGVALCERQHLVGHVDAERATRRPDTLRGEEHVDPAAGPEVEDALAWMEVGDRDRVAAPERGEDGSVGQLVALEGGVQSGADRLGIASNKRRPAMARMAAAA